MIEEWRPIAGFEGVYEVSSYGRIKSLARVVTRRDGASYHVSGKILSPSKHSEGYRQVMLRTPGVMASQLVHVLIATAFHGNPEPGQLVCHNNGNRADNRAENLRWGSRSENQLDQLLHGTHFNANKACCPRGHLLREGNLVLHRLKSGARICLACNRARGRINRHPEMKPFLQQVSDSYYADIRGAAA